MSVWFDDYYTIGEEKFEHNNRCRACFYDLLQAIDKSGAKDVKVDLFIFKNREDTSAALKRRSDVMMVSEEDMHRFLNLASNLFELPVITMAEKGKYKNLDEYTDNYDVYVLAYDFTGKSYIYIKSVLTYARYLFEDVSGFGRIVEAALDHSARLPEIPFIEIFAICHMSSDYHYNNSNHSLILSCSSYKDPSIYTERYLIKRLKDPTQKSVHKLFGILYEDTKPSRISSFQKITDELIINFKRISC